MNEWVKAWGMNEWMMIWNIRVMLFRIWRSNRNSNKTKQTVNNIEHFLNMLNQLWLTYKCHFLVAEIQQRATTQCCNQLANLASTQASCMDDLQKTDYYSTDFGLGEPTTIATFSIAVIFDCQQHESCPQCHSSVATYFIKMDVRLAT